jgi:NAD-dependent deacetylase
MTDVDIDELARTLKKSEDVVWVTGAGLSVASGIAPYRSGSDAVWARFITEWGTFEKFKEDPVAWWREFWVKAHGVDLKTVRPNAGHDAITALVKSDPHHNVITQNIDGLHRRSGVPEHQLIEIHGRHDRFACINPDCKKHNLLVESVDLSQLDAGVIPRCKSCKSPLRPVVLLFDETYDSHDLYNMRTAKRLLNGADVILFVGTSYSVGITDYAIRAGRYANARLIHINTEPAADYAFENLIGPAEQVLPELKKKFDALG